MLLSHQRTSVVRVSHGADAERRGSGCVPSGLAAGQVRSIGAAKLRQDSLE
jgi:hypothetical protein